MYKIVDVDEGEEEVEGEERLKGKGSRKDDINEQESKGKTFSHLSAEPRARSNFPETWNWTSLLAG